MHLSCLGLEREDWYEDDGYTDQVRTESVHRTVQNVYSPVTGNRRRLYSLINSQYNPEKRLKGTYSLEMTSTMVTVDEYSNFWNGGYFEDILGVIWKLKIHFTTYAIADTIWSDNEKRYTASEFKRFSAKWEFELRHLSLGSYRETSVKGG